MKVWNERQRAYVQHVAGNTKPADIAGRLALYGDPHSLYALYQFAHKQHISLRLHRRYHAPTRQRSSDTEDTIIKANIGRVGVAETVELLSARGYERTASAIRNRANRLGVSTRPSGLTVLHICRILPVSDHQVRGWIADGHLHAARVGGRHRKLYRVSEDELRRFIRAEIWRFNWRRVKPGSWQVEAKAAHLRAQMLSLPEASQALKVSRTCVWTWIEAGYVPGARQVCRNGVWRIPRASLQTLAELLRLSQTERRQLLASARQRSAREGAA